MIPSVNTICIDPNKPKDILQLFADKCFKIVSGKNTTGEFCLPDFAFPSDGYACTSSTLNNNSKGIELFNNNILNIGSPNEELDDSIGYARGVLIKITYPKMDINDEEVKIEDKKVKLFIETVADTEYREIPLYNLFTIFTNPKSKDPIDLINKIKIINENDLFEVKIDSLIIYDKSE